MLLINELFPFQYWKIIEKKIRKNAKKRIEKRNIIVTTGVNYDVLRGQPQINITDEAGNSIKVPTFLWKVKHIVTILFVLTIIFKIT